MHSTAFDLWPKANSPLLGFICSVSFVPSFPVAVSHRAVAQASCDAHPPAGTTSPQRSTWPFCNQRPRTACPLAVS